jgi:hypothetical protein
MHLWLPWVDLLIHIHIGVGVDVHVLCLLGGLMHISLLVPHRMYLATHLLSLWIVAGISHLV